MPHIKETQGTVRIGSRNGESKINQEKSKPGNRGNRDDSRGQSSRSNEKDIIDKRYEIVQDLIDDCAPDPATFQEVCKKTTEDGQNLIHQVLRKFKAKRATRTALDMIEALVLDEPALFIQADEDEKVPLLTSAASNIDIFFRVIDLVIPDSVRDFVKVACDKDYQMCSLRHVHKSCLEQHRKRIEPSRLGNRDDIEEPEEISPIEPRKVTQAGTDDTNESHCLHGLIHVDQMIEKDTHLRKTLSTALGQQKRRNGGSCLQSLLVGTNFDPRRKESTVIPLASFKLLLQLCPDAVFGSDTQYGYSPLQLAIRLYDNRSVDYDHLFSVIQALVERHPSSIYFKAGYDTREDRDKTAYRLLTEPKEVDGEPNLGSMSRKDTEELLKRTCIGSPHMTQDEKREFLYWNAKSVRQICLNLDGESSQLDRDYVSTIKDQSGLHFETVLDFVKLPYWKPQSRKPQRRESHSHADTHGHKGGGDDELEASDPYTVVFQWLWESGVRKIFTVEVNDDGPDPHTNAAIRESLRGCDDEKHFSRDFEVEVWKWKKFDICSETILKAAPMAREVHLYSSGNTAVFRGWASSSGLCELVKLEQLTIEIYPRNTNDEKDCEKYQQEFVKKLADQCPRLDVESIEVNYHGHQMSQSGSEETEHGRNRKDEDEPSNNMPDSDRWIEKLLGFKQFMNDILGSKEKPSVRVALLDDGAKLTDLHGTQNGASFRPDNGAYFVGPCSHGTEMARCIRDICPMAELYIARLDDSVENQKFTTASACKALQWAMDMDADVISMSWSFKKKGIENDEDEKAFGELVRKAVISKKVVLFGSLPDGGPIAETSQYAPVGLPGVIKIGSATVYGQKSKENVFANPDFLFPGEELKSSADKKVSGSSFSTAYASGLAALVLYCLKAHMELNDSYAMNGEYDFGDDRTKRLYKAKAADGMKAVFKILGQGNADDEVKGGLFVRPYITLKGNFEGSEVERLKAMRDIVTEMLPTKMLRTL